MYVNDLEAARDFFAEYPGDGYYESCVVVIEGNQIEITV